MEKTHLCANKIMLIHLKKATAQFSSELKVETGPYLAFWFQNFYRLEKNYV